MTQTATRTDVHSPKHFDPADYEYVGWIYTGPIREDMMWDPVDEEAMRFMAEHTHVGPHPTGQCDHCGSYFHYGSVWMHLPTGGYITVGHDCAAGAFLLPSKLDHDLAYLKRRVQQTRERIRRSERLAAYLDEHPNLDAAFGWVDEVDDQTAIELPDGTFFDPTGTVSWYVNVLRDMRSKLLRWGSLTDKQLAFAESIPAKAQAKIQERLQQATALTQAPKLEGGRREIEGTILHAKLQDSAYGWSRKMLVQLDDGNKVYGTLPDALYEAANEAARAEAGEDNRFHYTVTLEGMKGYRVRFTAKIDPKEDHFGFYSRPTKAALVAAPSAQEVRSE